MDLRLDQRNGAAVNVVDIGEFVRFLISGGTATIVNLAAVWVARHFVSFEWSLVAGVAAGSTISFMMSKLFAFRSKGWGSARGEAARFALVYGAGLVLYWLASVAARPMFLAARAPPQWADMGAVLSGAVVMTLTSYFGHRFFTYRRAPGLV